MTPRHLSFFKGALFGAVSLIVFAMPPHARAAGQSDGDYLINATGTEAGNLTVEGFLDVAGGFSMGVAGSDPGMVLNYAETGTTSYNLTLEAARLNTNFLWIDGGTDMPRTKMVLSGSNVLTLYGVSGTTAIVLNPDASEITVNGQPLLTATSASSSYLTVTGGTLSGNLTFANTGQGVLFAGGASLTGTSSGVSVAGGRLSVSGTAEQFRLSHSGTNYSAFSVSSGGDLTISPSGSDLTVAGNVLMKAPAGATTLSVLGNEGADARLEIQSDDGDDSADRYAIGVSAANNEFYITNASSANRVTFDLDGLLKVSNGFEYTMLKPTRIELHAPDEEQYVIMEPAAYKIWDMTGNTGVVRIENSDGNVANYQAETVTFERGGYSLTIGYDELTDYRNITFPNADGTVALTGPITTSGLTQGTGQLLGRTTAGTGAVEQIMPAVGTGGSDFNLSFSSGTLTLNLPDASATNRGVVTTGAQTFSGTKTFTAVGVGAAGGAITAPGGGLQFTLGGTSGSILYPRNIVGTHTFRIYNTNAATTASARLFVGNGSTDEDSLLLGTLGSGFTASGPLMQDGAAVLSGTNLQGGLMVGTVGAANLGFATSNTLRWQITSAGNFLPASDGTLSIGSSSNRLNSLFLSGTMGLPDNIRQTFNPGATNAGLNVGSQAGDPSSPSNGDIWYDSSAHTYDVRASGTTASLVTSLAAAATYLPLTGGTLSSSLVFSGSSANIGIGANYLSGDGDDEGIRIDSEGYIGIGTSTPSAKLSVNGTAAPELLFSVTSPNGANNADYIAKIINSDTTANQSNGLFIQAGVSSADAPLAVVSQSGSSPYFYVRGNGDIGVGTAAPSYKVHVTGTGAIDQVLESTTTGTTSRAIMTVRSGTATVQVAQYSSGIMGDIIPGLPRANLSFVSAGGASSGLMIHNDNNTPLVFATDDSERMRVTGAGDVGIGTSNPTAKLEVDGDVKISGAVYIEPQGDILMGEFGEE